MRAHPWAIDGPGRENAVTIAETGVLAKVGAEGVLVLATADRAGRRDQDARRREPCAHRRSALELLVRAGLLARDRADAVLAVVGEPGLRVDVLSVSAHRHHAGRSMPSDPS